MATINANGDLGGLIGPVVIKTFNGKRVVQSRPAKVRQTKATVASASVFGNASRASKKIREALRPILQDLADTAMYRRFTAALFEAATMGKTQADSRKLEDGTLSLLNNFQFNANSPMADYCMLLPELHSDTDGRLVLALPAFLPADYISFPEGAHYCELRYLVCSFDPADWSETYSTVFRSGEIARKEIPAQQFTTDAIAAGQVVFVVGTVLFYNRSVLMGDFLMNSKELHPVGVVGCFRG